MTKLIDRLFVIIVILVVGCAYAVANEREWRTAESGYHHQPSVGLKVVDALFVRVPMVPASIASTVVFTAISPFVYMMGIGAPMLKAMVEAPWRFTADRPLGDFTGETKDGMPIYDRMEW